MANRLRQSIRHFSANTRQPKPLRPIHFEHEEAKDVVDARPFRIIGVRDVEVADHQYPTRIESEQKSKSRDIRNAYQEKNFISLFVDPLEGIQKHLKETGVNFDVSEGSAEDEKKVLIAPQQNQEMLFDLCGARAFVEILQAPEELIEEFENDQLSPEDIAPEVEEPEPYKFEAKIVPST
uniref:Uncharacterized protein AlNc14C114G6468 n=1 Tax=Albugo laibachii Nc14 TaxID=890382 RepID=F0WIT3_9STRA|nr:conserved hypothetical protein [Albugo laibachii Nc14]|eukprot:CCA21177.1 conserved hypothetical protein [Albugo laibachii Nc14]